MHRDIKPANILIFEPADDILIFKICDFGISKDFKNITEDFSIVVLYKENEDMEIAELII